MSKKDSVIIDKTDKYVEIRLLSRIAYDFGYQ